MFDRESSKFISEYQKSRYDRATMVLKTRYLTFLVDKDKWLLHQSTLLFTTKGSFCGSFGETLKQFHSEMSKAYGAATHAKKPRGESAKRRHSQRFMALSVLAVRVTPVLKGDRKKSWVCSVELAISLTSKIGFWLSSRIGLSLAILAVRLLQVRVDRLSLPNRHDRVNWLKQTLQTSQMTITAIKNYSLSKPPLNEP